MFTRLLKTIYKAISVWCEYSVSNKILFLSPLNSSLMKSINFVNNKLCLIETLSNDSIRFGLFEIFLSQIRFWHILWFLLPVRFFYYYCYYYFVFLLFDHVILLCKFFFLWFFSVTFHIYTLQNNFSSLVYSNMSWILKVQTSSLIKNFRLIPNLWRHKLLKKQLQYTYTTVSHNIKVPRQEYLVND